MAHSNPPLHAEHSGDCPRHPNNLRHSALTMTIVPDCFASCPKSASYRQLPPFTKEIAGLFSRTSTSLGDILFDLHTNKPILAVGAAGEVVVAKNGWLYCYRPGFESFNVQVDIPELLVALEINNHEIIALDARGKIYNLFDPEKSFLPEIKDVPVVFLHASPSGGLWVVTLDGRIFHRDKNALLTRIPFSPKAKAISKGSQNNMIVQLANDEVLAQGENRHGELGYRGTHSDELRLLLPPPGRTTGEIQKIEIGAASTVFQFKNGDILTCGINNVGQLGYRGTHSDEWRPIALPKGKTTDQIEKIEMGAAYTVLQFKNGDIFSCGVNNEGQLGCGDMRPNSLSWIQVQGLPAGILFSISVGFSHTIALGADGTLWGWGSNLSGQLGPLQEGSTRCSPTPIRIAEEYWESIVAVAISWDSTFFLVEMQDVSVVFQTYKECTPRDPFKLIMRLNNALNIYKLLTADSPPPSPSAASAAVASAPPSKEQTSHSTPLSLRGSAAHLPSCPCHPTQRALSASAAAPTCTCASNLLVPPHTRNLVVISQECSLVLKDKEVSLYSAGSYFNNFFKEKPDIKKWIPVELPPLNPRVSILSLCAEQSCHLGFLCNNGDFYDSIPFKSSCKDARYVRFLKTRLSQKAYFNLTARSILQAVSGNEFTCLLNTEGDVFVLKQPDFTDLQFYSDCRRPRRISNGKRKATRIAAGENYCVIVYEEQYIECLELLREPKLYDLSANLFPYIATEGSIMEICCLTTKASVDANSRPMLVVLFHQSALCLQANQAPALKKLSIPIEAIGGWIFREICSQVSEHEIACLGKDKKLYSLKIDYQGKETSDNLVPLPSLDAYDPQKNPIVGFSARRSPDNSSPANGPSMIAITQNGQLYLNNNKARDCAALVRGELLHPGPPGCILC